ncbi:MAG: class IV adenylate cyclase [Eubacteriales bacterium]|nr:class IV adenylate cyclase [Eubacteriales bacterium]
MTEVEIKLPIKDMAGIISGLTAMGFRPGSTIEETDVYFDSVHEQIRKNGEALRIRRIRSLDNGETESVITFKGKKLDRVSMTRQELETGISDAETGIRILSALGFLPVSPKVVKTRRSYHCEEITSCVDHVQNLGGFLELEVVIGEEEARDSALSKIETILNRLGFQMSDTTRTSYLSMLQNRED